MFYAVIRPSSAILCLLIVVLSFAFLRRNELRWLVCGLGEMRALCAWFVSSGVYWGLGLGRIEDRNKTLVDGTASKSRKIQVVC